MYDHVTIYYFSGTGNALTAGRWIRENAEKKGIKADLIPIDRFKEINVPVSEGKRLLGFCYPTHGFGIPWFMLKFISRFPARERCDVFLLNTRAGSKIFKWFAPGVSGIAQILPALILLVKGFRIRSLLPLDMPSNWVSVHPGYNQATVAALVARCRAMVYDFCAKVFVGRRHFRANVFVMMPLDIALAPIAFMYFMYGRFFFAKVFIASTDCDSCSLCEQKCPTASIRMVNKRPFWKFTCESCMRCINICPRKAIQASHSLAVVIVVVSSFLPLALLLKIVNSYIPTALQKPADFIVNWGILLTFIFIISGLVFWLIRLKWINKLFSATSLTKYWRRYLAPGIKPRDY
jgi:NAD-dependent dihydropyrimidine dehydrogenase PreA subunit